MKYIYYSFKYKQKLGKISNLKVTSNKYAESI